MQQVQYHVGMGPLSLGSGVNSTDDMEYNRALGVTFQSFSPLCGPCEGDDRYFFYLIPFFPSYFSLFFPLLCVGLARGMTGLMSLCRRLC